MNCGWFYKTAWAGDARSACLRGSYSYFCGWYQLEPLDGTESCWFFLSEAIVIDTLTKDAVSAFTRTRPHLLGRLRPGATTYLCN